MAIRSFWLAGAALWAMAPMAGAIPLAQLQAAPSSVQGDDGRAIFAHRAGWRDRAADPGRRSDRGRCDRGGGGTIIGAIAGGLLGNTIGGRGDRTIGTVAGGGAGALAGRAIDRDC